MAIAKRLIALFLILGALVFCLYKIDIIGLVNKWAKIIDENNVAKIEEVNEEYYVTAPEFLSCYNSLDKEQRKIYNKIYSISEEMPADPTFLCGEYEAVLKDVAISYRALLNDHPEIFWMPESYLLTKTEGKGYKKNINIDFDYENDEGKRITYLANKETRDKMQKTLKSKVEEIVAKAEKEKDEFGKEKFLNDYICKNTEYTGDDGFVNTAYGCIVNKKALCEGYSKAFKLLCNKMMIECDLIVGKAEGENHMWNSVNIDGKHNFVDVTWNDNENFPYMYFNITDEQLIFDHTLSPLYSEVPEQEIKAGISFNFVKRICSFVGNNYYEKEGTVLGDDFEHEYGEKAALKITEDFNNNLKNTDFLLKNEHIKGEFLKDEELFVLNIQKYLDGIRIESYVFQRDILVVYYEDDYN